MKQGPRWSILAALCILSLIGVLVETDDRQRTTTTFGTIPPGYGALYDLLSELELPVSRSYVSPQALPPAATVWWVEPQTLCAGPGVKAAGDAAAGAASDEPEWAGRAWIEAGGTAVVLLMPRSERAKCASIAGVALPDRIGGYEAKAADVTAPPEDAEATAEPQRRKRPVNARFAAPPAVEQVVGGTLIAVARRIESAGLAFFARADDWNVVALLDGQPFALERRLGSGRLVVVADAAALRNAWLDRADNALLAVDLVGGYGAPRFDERDHGLRLEDSALRYIATSAALPLFVGLTLVALLFVWRGRTVPPRRLAAQEAPAPTLETFVGSLAGSYATTADYPRVLQQYREVTAARLRRHFGLPASTPSAALLGRLQARRLDARLLQSLAAPGSVHDDAGLRGAVRLLDELVREATR